MAQTTYKRVYRRGGFGWNISGGGYSHFVARPIGRSWAECEAEFESRGLTAHELNLGDWCMDGAAKAVSAHG